MGVSFLFLILVLVMLPPGIYSLAREEGGLEGMVPDV
ncbi:MAG: hypothetical protein H6Q56_1747 [Deltaproteobacteria bacterium]|nr:hypothetical protein [Deltaproteobacteria bacterium]